MAIQSSLNKAFELPRLRKILKTSPYNPDSEKNHFWDTKFYPFDHSPEAPPVFALCNAKNMLVCQISLEQDNDIEIIRVFAIEGEEPTRDVFCACTWAFIDPDEPLLVGAGDSGVIRVFDVVNGNLKTSLSGHGQGVINDLVTHPKYPWIVASASHDKSIRIWDLRRWNNNHEPRCVVICGHGNGHREMPLCASWHDSGRYIVTGGLDHRICVWTIPDLSPESSFWVEISPSQRKRSADEVRVIYYPHFVTSAVHTNFVDCVCFWGDLVLSKAAEENKIVLWSITGFNSRSEPPNAVLAPKTEEHLDTRNGFMRTLTVSSDGIHSIDIPEIYKSKLAYSRLLEFQAPSTRPFFLRFDLLKPSLTHPDLHPVLAIGNTQSAIYLWDLYALEHGYNPLATRAPRGKKYPAALAKKGIATPIDRGRFKTQGQKSSTSGAASSPSSSRRSTSLQRSSSLQRAVSTETGATSDLFSPTSFPRDQSDRQPQPQTQTHILPERDRDRYPLHLPKKPLEHTRVIKMADFTQATFTARGVGWSPDGKWCVVAGETAERAYATGVKTEKLREEVGIGKKGKGRRGRGRT